jgi:hypothetical protein
MKSTARLPLRRLLILAALSLAGCGGGGGAAADSNWYYHFVCNGDPACLSTNFAGTSQGTSNLGPGAGGQSGCNSLMNFGTINWNIPPAQQSCDHSPTIPPPPMPTVTLAVSPSPIDLGQTATLTWSSTNATSCTASNAWSGSKSLNGTTNVSPVAGGSYIYTLTCTGAGGSASTSATLVVNAPAVSISVTPSTVTDGASATLSWSTMRTSSCTASGAWSGATALSGSQPVSPSAGTFTFTLTCIGTGGVSASNSATLTVNPSSSLQPAPTVTISVSPTSVSSTQSAVLTWTTTHATSCTADGSWTGDMALSGTVTLPAQSPGHYDYALTCNGSDGSASGVATLNVASSGSPVCSPPSVNIAVTPSAIVEGASATLSWTASRDPSCSSPQLSCTASGAWSGPVAASGTLGVAPSAGSFTYVLTCGGRNATVSRSATLAVSATTPPPSPIVNIAVAPAGINLGESATLTWSSSGVRSCAASGAWSGSVGLGGNLTVAPGAVGSYDYTLTCLGSNGSIAHTATLSVEAAAGTTATARFNHPYRVVVDSAGNIYVADTLNDTIRKITPANAVTTLAGLAGNAGSADGTGATARFNLPSGIAIDDADKLLVADTANNTIRAITTAAAVSTPSGLAGTAGAADGSGAAAHFSNPYGLATDSSGNVYIADMANNTIRMMTPAGVVTTIAGTAGVTGSTDATGAAASFNGPRDVATDGAGNLYVADTGNLTVRKITSGGVVTTLAGTAGSSITVGSGDGTGSAARFAGPTGVATDSGGNVYVADSNASTIRKITPAGVVTTFAGSLANPGSADGTGTSAQFRAASGVATDSADNIYVADTFNCTIRKITPAAVVTTIAGQVMVCGSGN